MRDVTDLSAVELAPLLRTRAVSPVEVVDAILDRIDSLNGLLGAYLHVAADHARAAAQAAESEILANRWRGPLHGIPVGYKDIYDVRGLPTTAGSRLRLGHVAARDSTVAARLREAGTICLGKLNTFEFASGGMESLGPAHNPWNTRLTPGGSSSGSGVALAARLVTVATGTDTGGSIRIPAAHCGVAGLKPTYGRVSRAGIVPLSWSLDHAGPMARCVGDLALLLGATAGPDPDDPAAADRPVPSYLTALKEDLSGLCVGVPEAFFLEVASSEVQAATRAAITQLAALGAEVRSVVLPHAIHGAAASSVLAYSESFAYHRENFFARARDYTPAFLHKITAAALLTAPERVTAQQVRRQITEQFLAALRDVDAIVTPTAPHPAHVADGGPQAVGSGVFTRPASLAGLPALAVPCGFTATGLPMSLQIIGRAWDEATVLRIGHAYERATPWHTRRPPMEEGALSGPPAFPPPLRDPAVTPEWVLAMARLTGLDYVTEADAAPIAALLAPVRAQLALARAQVDPATDPGPIRL
jgi:aspartyl-tRNA(Asn)/glutamyl-tRNA(Gln) amidotransferase subunit A